MREDFDRDVPGGDDHQVQVEQVPLHVLVAQEVQPVDEDLGRAGIVCLAV